MTCESPNEIDPILLLYISEEENVLVMAADVSVSIPSLSVPTAAEPSYTLNSQMLSSYQEVHAKVAQNTVAGSA